MEYLEQDMPSDFVTKKRVHRFTRLCQLARTILAFPPTPRIYVTIEISKISARDTMCNKGVDQKDAFVLLGRSQNPRIKRSEATRRGSYECSFVHLFWELNNRHPKLKLKYLRTCTTKVIWKREKNGGKEGKEAKATQMNGSPRPHG